MGRKADVETFEKTKQTIADRIVTLRHLLRIDQSAFAKKIGLCRQSLYYYEKAERMITPDLVVKLHNLFGVSSDWLIGIKDKDRAVERLKKTNY